MPELVMAAIGPAAAKTCNTTVENALNPLPQFDGYDTSP
jgi:hypothetical protein